MKQRVDIMVDIETLGTEPGSTIFQIAAAAFDITNGDIVSEFDKVADIYCRDDLKIMGGTLKFWLNDNRETYFKLQERASGCPHVMVADFWRWLTAFTDQEDADVYLWGNGILFDNLFLKKAFQEEGLDYPISFRNDRDVRTLREMAEMKAGLTGVPFSYEKVGTAHDALDDVRSQINMVVAAFNSLMPKTTSPF
ncbi:3'-5' exonuclease [Rhodococcus sp. IEGM1300]